MTYPHDILTALRSQTGADQMAVFAEALISRNETPHLRDLPLIAAAYVLGRVDALKPNAAECAGSAGPMAWRVLTERGLLFDSLPHPANDDLPF